MIASSVTCDVCGRQKQETNHWFLCFTMKGALGITFGAYNDRDLVPARRGLNIQDICGEACAHTRLSQFLDSLNPASERTTS